MPLCCPGPTARPRSGPSGRSCPNCRHPPRPRAPGGQPAQRTQAVVEGHHHHAFAGDVGAVVNRIEPEPMTKPPPWSQTITGRRFPAASAGAQMFRARQSSSTGPGLPMKSGWGAEGLGYSHKRGAVHAWGGWGGRQRFGPVGGARIGQARKAVDAVLLQALYGAAGCIDCRCKFNIAGVHGCISGLTEGSIEGNEKWLWAMSH